MFKGLIPDLCKAVMENLHTAECSIESMENEKELEMVYVHGNETFEDHDLNFNVDVL